MSRTAIQALLRWTAVALWAAVIFGMSSVPGSNVPGNFSIQAHFTEYLILGALVCYALAVHWGVRASLIGAVLIASLYGVSDEWHQSLVPMRTPDPWDWLVDTIGATVGAGLVALWLHRRATRKNQ